jgi:gluconate 2-dehydrogenase gamma chain
MSSLTRRAALKLLAAVPAAATVSWSDAEASIAGELTRTAQASGAAFTPKFFTPHEWQTVRLLVDIIIPSDERSGSATDAGVPEFMDFMMLDQPARQVAMRGGLAWLDRECESRFDKRFVSCADSERTAVLDDIAWSTAGAPGRPLDPVPGAPRSAVALMHGIVFFNSFRDLTATGFWTTRMGIEDVQYTGNRVVPRWTGCPEEALKKLGVSY